MSLEPSTLPPLVATTGLDAQDGGPDIDIVDRLNAQTKRLAAKTKSEPGDEDYACLQLVKGGATVRFGEGGREGGREGGDDPSGITAGRKAWMGTCVCVGVKR